MAASPILHWDIDNSALEGTLMNQQIANFALTNDDLYLFAKGEWFRSYEKLGAHPAVRDGVEGYHFAVWAPDVESVHVLGDFNGWDPDATPLSPTIIGGIWHGFVPGVGVGELYKFQVITREGDILMKADPYAFWADDIPGTASKTCDLSLYEWRDEAWLERRATFDDAHNPLNIFEVHLGSWKRHEPEEGALGPGAYLTYEELSRDLIAYVKHMGYTHIEILPIAEHPFDGSWGYQVGSYYAPTSRYGDPLAFKAFVDACHEAEVGVILDWVPSGFCKDEPGLVHFNGTRLYESTEHPNWGTLKFNLDRDEVRSFLISNLLFWIDEYHADGIRMDGVTSMLYLNFGLTDRGMFRYAPDGTENDYTSVAFIRRCNEVVDTYFPEVMMIAEESSAWPRVTRPIEEGGLGFDYKWDMGWMNDTLFYCQVDYEDRGMFHDKLTFSLMYAFDERFILPLSHDEVVHGKKSLLARQPGDWWRQMAGLRVLSLWQMTHPGGKLNFMGNEIGQFIEWRYDEGIEYSLTEKMGPNSKHQLFESMLNQFYLSHPALFEFAHEEEGFEWIEPDDAGQSVISFCRHGKDPADDLVVIINFRPVAYESYRIGVPRWGLWREVFNTDDELFGGSGVTNEGRAFKAEDVDFHRHTSSIEFRLPPLAGIVFAYAGKHEGSLD